MVESTFVDEVLIAMPTAPGEVIRRVVDLARQTKVNYRIIPGMYDILSGNVSITQIRDVDVEDLLRRDPVRLNMDEIDSYLENRVVLVTGAGGSIGSEIVRQITPFNPRLLVAVDRDENGLYMLEREVESHFPKIYCLHLLDVRYSLSGLWEARMPMGGGSTGCYGLGLPEHLSRFLVDTDSPEVHAAAAVTREVDMLSIRGPARTPIFVGILGDGNGLAPLCW